MKTAYLMIPLLVVPAMNALACDLSIANQWVREPLPGIAALAAYGTLSNASDKAIKITTVSSEDFARVETHETLMENGIGKMRPAVIEVPAKGSVEFMRGGKHFMLIEPKKVFKAGDSVVLRVTDSAGCTSSMTFTVGNRNSTTSSSMPPMKTDR